MTAECAAQCVQVRHFWGHLTLQEMNTVDSEALGWPLSYCFCFAKAAQKCSAGSPLRHIPGTLQICDLLQVLLGGKPAVLDTAWKPAKDTEHVLAAVAAVQAQHWPVLESISTPEAFAKAWEFYLLVSTAHPHGETCLCAH